jgi:hypothetical protein
MKKLQNLEEFFGTSQNNWWTTNRKIMPRGCFPNLEYGKWNCTDPGCLFRNAKLVFKFFTSYIIPQLVNAMITIIQGVAKLTYSKSGVL